MYSVQQYICNKVFQWLAADRWFSPGTPVSSTNKSDRNDITEILLKVALNTINLLFFVWWSAYMIFSVWLFAIMVFFICSLTVCFVLGSLSKCKYVNLTSFISGEADIVRCFCCDLGVAEWANTDDVSVEHARHSSTCRFLKTQKGEALLHTL